MSNWDKMKCGTSVGVNNINNMKMKCGTSVGVNNILI